MTSGDRRSDAELLLATATDPQAFAIFYRRHVPAVLAYLVGRTHRAELAADICAEVFASALESRSRYDESRGGARSWLLSMASSRLIDAARRGAVEDRARARLGMPVLELGDSDLERIDELLDPHLQRAGELLEGLPIEQREAIRSRVIEERDYSEIAASVRCSQHVIRKRVSRGLTTMRTQLAKESSL
jgi:RNA polymerase sigma factor (sigma-70 family)